MNIRLTRGAFAGLPITMCDHHALALIARGEAVAMTETATKPEPASVEHATKPGPASAELAAVVTAAVEHATVTNHRRKGGRS